MENNFKLKSLVILVLVGFIIFVVYLSSQSVSNDPVVVMRPLNYPEGTTISLYKNIPPNFIDGIVLEDKKLETSQVVASNGKSQYNLSYVSQTQIAELVNMYKKSLSEKGWRISLKNHSPKVSAMSISKEENELFITFVQVEKGTNVTFQYEK